MHLLTDGKYSGRRKNRTGEGSQTLIFEEAQDNLEMHHQLNGYEFEEDRGAWCATSRGHKEADMI